MQGVPRYWMQCNPYKGIFVGLQLRSTNQDIYQSINHIDMIIITILFFRFWFDLDISLHNCQRIFGTSATPINYFHKKVNVQKNHTLFSFLFSACFRTLPTNNCMVINMVIDEMIYWIALSMTRRPSINTNKETFICTICHQ